MVSTKCAPPPPLKGGGTQILEISKRGEPEKKFGVGETKRGGDFENERVETQLFKLNLGIKKGQKWELS